MKLDRNDPDNDGAGKYALILLRRLDDFRAGTFRTLPADILAALDLLRARGIIDEGIAGTESEFFVIRLKDKYAGAALAAYAEAAAGDDLEWGSEVAALARRAGLNSPWVKKPD